MSKYKVGDEVLVKCEIVGTDDKDGKNHYNVQTKIDVAWVEEDEIFGKEPKADGIPVIPQSEVDAYNKGHADGMAQGSNDAWEFMSKLYSMTTDVAYEIFGTNCIEIMLRDLTPQEALAKMKAYEDSKIKVGDVVTCIDTDEKAMFLGKDECSEIGWFLLKEYDVPQKIAMREVKKTGKRLDISSILEHIGE